MNKKHFFLMALGTIGLVVLIYFSRKQQENYLKIDDKTSYLHIKDNEYAGSLSCRECHLKEYEEWYHSDHKKAMEIATNSSVLGDFNNKTLVADGITSRFFKKDGKFYIHTEDENGQYRDFEVLYTFGHYPLQQYLTAFEKGRMQVFRQSWDSRENKWFHQYAKMTIPHQDYLHWTGNAQNWNLMCGSCHATGYHKGYDAFSDSYHTTYQEMSVGCESCHKPSKKHIAFVKSKDYIKGQSKSLYVDKSSTFNKEQAINQCAYCHTRRGEVSQKQISSEKMLDNFIPEILSQPNYYQDGQAYDEVYKVGSFLSSKMYHQAGVKCTSCHQPHTSKLKMPAEKVCFQCHSESLYATNEHTFHKEGTLASDCRSCHMPVRTYMGNDHRHDHNFAPPRPDLSLKYGTPNACNTCHSNKSFTWADNALKKWYPKKKTEHFAEDLILSSFENKDKLKSISKLLVNDKTPDIIKATAINHLSNLNQKEAFNLIRKYLSNENDLIRYQSVRALMNFDVQEIKSEIYPLLQDPVKAVRVATSNLILTQEGVEKARQAPHFVSAEKELQDFILSQADFAQGSVVAGEYFFKINDIEKAILFYERAIEKDRDLNFVRLNLATLYAKENDTNKSLQILLEAQTFEPKNPQIYYLLGLLYTEMQSYEKAKDSFKKAIDLGDHSEKTLNAYQELISFLKLKSTEIKKD